MSYYSRNMACIARLETTLRTGRNGKVTIGAAVSGVLPTGAATVSGGGGTAYIPGTYNVRFVGSGGATARGTVTVTGTAISSAAVTSGGGGYTNGAPAVFDVVGDEFEYGFWSAPVTASDAILIGDDMELTLNVPKVTRNILRSFMGNAPSLPGTSYAQASFTIELAPSGILGQAPAWAPLIQAAGFAQTYTTSGASSVKIDYTPVSSNFPSVSFSAFFGDTRVDMIGARVSQLDFDLSVEGVPKVKVTIIGITRLHNAIAFPAPDLSAWMEPRVITDSSVGNVYHGTTYSNTTGAISGGVFYPTSGMKFSVANNAKFKPRLGGNRVPITQREVSGSYELDLLADDRVAFYDAMLANSTSSLSQVMGGTAGSIMKFYMPTTERAEPRNVDDDGELLAGYSFRANPANGNDELRIVCM